MVQVEDFDLMSPLLEEGGQQRHRGDRISAVPGWAEQQRDLYRFHE
jgi:hypothetical protein